ncbi:LysR family transcriptional regulator [Halomonas aquamarina]|uniref:LysR family transcriptional regulator n=1 Tax=Vreelandella aquamarina TaxID=77097 RepID=A0ACC5VTM1_9GAMM|nr:LysR substrate-binding domain-containing protein [Halomonas aquamarina]MBZ5487228.1 LysR family transcriptional regulator [Halomonas aquamarina]
MELVWLEDFAALAEHKSFVRAAEARHITQPAFSRRIRALEQWMGVSLFVRTPQGTALTDAGRHIHAGAVEAAGQLYRLRAEAQEIGGKGARTLQFAATHSLSFTFFPRWIRRLEQGTPMEALRLHSDTMAACEQLLLHGDCQFLLCHRHVAVPSPLSTEQFESLKVGEDTLIPLVGRELSTQGLETMPYLAYTQASGLGRVVSHWLDENAVATPRAPHFESHLAAVLMSMAMENKGLAWLPRSLAEQEIAEGRLVRGLERTWDIPLEIHLTRAKGAVNGLADAFWKRLAEG